MFEILRRFSPLVEEYSIDEAFIDLTGLRRKFHGSYAEIAAKVQKTISAELGITISTGVSISKVLSKIASKYKKPAGLTVIPGKEIHRYLLKVKEKSIVIAGLFSIVGGKIFLIFITSFFNVFSPVAWAVYFKYR
jgi:DNA polymerase-4/DNA polymerase V